MADSGPMPLKELRVLARRCFLVIWGRRENESRRRARTEHVICWLNNSNGLKQKQEVIYTKSVNPFLNVAKRSKLSSFNPDAKNTAATVLKLKIDGWVFPKIGLSQKWMVKIMEKNLLLHGCFWGDITPHFRGNTHSTCAKGKLPCQYWKEPLELFVEYLVFDRGDALA